MIRLKIGAALASSLLMGTVAMGTTGSSKHLSRHYIVLTSGIPEPYTSTTNPLPPSQAAFETGAALYAQNCIACHGRKGVGNGKAGRDLSPRPRNLVWLSDIPEKQWDAFIFWTVAEGGVPLGTAMPPYKDRLTANQIWAVTLYVEENFPFEVLESVRDQVLVWLRREEARNQ